MKGDGEEVGRKLEMVTVTETRGFQEFWKQVAVVFFVEGVE